MIPADNPVRPAAPALADGMQGMVLGALLGEARRLALHADSILAPISTNRELIRERLLGAGRIVAFDPPTTDRPTIAAVDGGSVTERMYAADMLVAVAVSAEGMTGPTGLPLGHSVWTAVERHQRDLDRLTGAAMVAQELRVLHDLTHDLRIFDGSHGTPVIGLSAALFSRNDLVRKQTVDLCEMYGTVEALSVLSGQHPGGTVVALPKGDSSRAFADLYQKELGLVIESGDRFLAAQVLSGGEMFLPRPASEYKDLNFESNSEDERATALARDLNEAILSVREAAKSGLLQVTYIKPETSDTVVKIEFYDGDGIVTAKRLGRQLSDETPGPHLQEPFAQHMADLAAKTVSPGAGALSAAMLQHLPVTAETYLPYLARGYRT